jgi:tRNA pseudouridine55 synthase
LNEATKLVPFNLEGPKEYVAAIRLGQETDTLDADGKVISETGGFAFTRQEIEEILGKFRGVIRQRPPIFSAIKKEGVPVYQRARAGEALCLAEREARIDSLILQDLSLPRVTITVTCGRGTYIRSLAADIGKALGCGAHIAELRRLRTGLFTLAQAVSIEGFADLVKQGTIQERLIRLEDCVVLPVLIQVTPQTAEQMKQGKPIHLWHLPQEDWGRLKKGQRVGLCDGPQHLFAIAESRIDGASERSPESPALRILRVFLH